MSFKCTYMEGCPMYNHLTTAVRIIQLQPFLEGYCLNKEHYQKCARYKIIGQGNEPPYNLLPNGAILKV
jgi:hypothetical protein